MFNQNLFPTAQRVFAKTLGLDLVSVKPMSAPNIGLLYMDYQYGGSKSYIRKKKIKNIFPDEQEIST